MCYQQSSPSLTFLTIYKVVRKKETFCPESLRTLYFFPEIPSALIPVLGDIIEIIGDNRPKH